MLGPREYNFVISIIIIVAVIAVILFTACEIGSVMKTTAKCNSESGCADGPGLGDVALAGISAGSSALESGELSNLINSAGGGSDWMSMTGEL